MFEHDKAKIDDMYAMCIHSIASFLFRYCGIFVNTVYTVQQLTLGSCPMCSYIASNHVAILQLVLLS